MSEIKYKLTDQDGWTRRGLYGGTLWRPGTEVIASGPGNKPCTSGVIHFYDSPELGIMFNPLHANIFNPRCICVQVSEICGHDGLKGWCKRAKCIGSCDVPHVSLEHVVRFAICCAFRVNQQKNAWAQDWLLNRDRSQSSAREAAQAAQVAAEAAKAKAQAAAKAAARFWMAGEPAAQAAQASAAWAAWAEASAAWAAAAQTAWTVRAAAAQTAWAAAEAAAVKHESIDFQAIFDETLKGEKDASK